VAFLQALVELGFADIATMPLLRPEPLVRPLVARQQLLDRRNQCHERSVSEAQALA
jgi:hypothetical protein